MLHFCRTPGNSLLSWIDTVTLLRKFNNDILVSVWVGPDGKNSDDFIVQFDQSDLLLPSIDYYKLGASHPIIKARVLSAAVISLISVSVELFSLLLVEMRNFPK